MSSTPPSSSTRTPRFTRFAARGGLCAAVLAGSVAGLAALSSSAASAAPASPNLSGLTLLNGWQSQQSVYGSGNPAVTREADGVVHLSGSMANGTSSEAFVLPIADRPSVNIYIDDYTYQGTSGFLEITTSGAVYAAGDEATVYTSLAGISFPSKGSTLSFTTESLVNGWTSEQSVYGTGNPSVAVDAHGVVHLSGSLAGGASDTTAFTLPVGARPVRATYVNTYTVSGTVGSLYIQPSGKVIPFGTNVGDYTSLAGVTFRTTTTGNKALTLQNGWQPDTTYNTGAPAMYKDPAGIVHLSGGLNVSSDAQPVLTLPAGARPGHNLWMPIYTFDGTPGTIVIYTDGTVYLYGAATSTTGVSTADEFTSLTGITFQAGA